jgi:hypothetical protein
MLMIRKEQLDTLARAEAEKFEEWMHVHLKRFFPQQYETIGEPGVREVIRYAIVRAGTYGLTSKCDVCKYIDLTILFGRDFDLDLQFPWARDILRTQEVPEVKIQDLWEAAKHHLRRM